MGIYTKGKVVLIGAGPGDPSLLTIAAKRYIQKADCIIYDRLIGNEILDLAQENCELIYVGKENHNHTLSQSAINGLLYEKTFSKKLIVRLKGGDPYVFGRGSEEFLHLYDRRVNVEVVPGISSCIAVLEYAGIPLTHRGVSRGFHVFTAHTQKDIMTGIDFSRLTAEDETCVFLMGMSHIEEISMKMIEAGRDPETPAAVISNGTMLNQKKCIGTLKNICALAKEQNIESPGIIVVGNVVKLSSKLDFFENRPLFKKKILVPYIANGSFSMDKGWITSSTSELAEELSSYGAEVYTTQTGMIVPQKCRLDILDMMTENDFLIFTSKNAVNAFMWNLAQEHKDSRNIGKAAIAVIGAKTESELRRFGIRADYVSRKGNGFSMIEELCTGKETPFNILWYTAKESSELIENSVQENCRLIKEVCYENSHVFMEKVSNMAEMDAVMFTSASNVLRTLQHNDQLPGNIVSIGPSCSEALKEHGYIQHKMISKPSYKNMIDALLEII